jgi:hypothetical protein
MQGALPPATPATPEDRKLKAKSLTRPAHRNLNTSLKAKKHGKRQQKAGKQPHEVFLSEQS